MARPEVHVFPKSSLNDVDLDITVTGLAPHQRITLRAHVFTESGKYRFESSAEYRADERGVVNVKRDPSIGGSYTGTEPMGLFWSLTPAPEIRNKWPRLVKRNILKPFVYTFELVDESETILHSTTAERHYLASYVDRHLTKHGVADGCLYLPQKKGNSDPFPVVLDIRGGVTFLVEDRPSLLASHGLAVFSINYFVNLTKGRIVMSGNRYFDLQIFLDIYDFIVKHPRLDETRVGIVSSCMGGVLALQAVTRLGDRIPFRCISVTGCVDLLAYETGLKLLDGKLVEPFESSEVYEVVEDSEGSHIYQLTSFDAYDNLEGDFIVPVEDLPCNVLFITLGDDHHIPSFKRMSSMKRRIEKAGKGHLVESIHLEGAGHFIDAPYLPLCRRSNMDPSLPYPVFGEYGGDPRLHSYAINKAWRKTINWFRSQLGVTEVYRDDWLDVPNNDAPHINSRL